MPEAKRKWTLGEKFAIVIAMCLLGLLAELFIRRGSGLPTSIFAAMMVLAVQWRWDLSDRRWFWSTVVTLVVVHATLIWSIHWTTKWIPAVMTFPFGYVDLLLILRVFSFAEAHFSRIETSPR